MNLGVITSIRTVAEGVLLLSRNAVGIFYGLSRRGSKGNSPKVNVVARLKFEHANYDITSPAR